MSLDLQNNHMNMWSKKKPRIKRKRVSFLYCIQFLETKTRFADQNKKQETQKKREEKEINGGKRFRQSFMLQKRKQGLRNT